VEHGLALNPSWRDAQALKCLLEVLAASGAGDAALQMIDSTVIRAHQHSAGAKKGGAIRTPWADLAVASVPKSMC
jgi:transposase